MGSADDFVAGLGRPFVAHRLRRLSELFVDGYGDWLPRVGVSAPPRSLSTLLLLHRRGALPVTEIATRLRLTHPLLIKLVGRLTELGLTTDARDEADGRRRLISLTPQGRAEVRRIEHAVAALDRAYARLFDEIGIDLIEAVERVERACAAEGFAHRLAREDQPREEDQCDSS